MLKNINGIISSKDRRVNCFEKDGSGFFSPFRSDFSLYPRGKSTFSDSLRTALLISATAGALLFACNTFAGAQGASTNDPIVPPDPPCNKEFIDESGAIEPDTRLCEDDVSRGVELELGGVGNSYNKLVVRNLTGNITPNEGKEGVELSTTDNRNIDIDVDTGIYKITTTGDDADGIYGQSDGTGTITITHQGDIVTAGEDAHGIYGESDGTGAITITHQGDITTAGEDAYGIYGESDGAVSIILNGKSSIKSNHVTGIGVGFSESGENNLNINGEVTIFGKRYDVDGRAGDETITNKGVFTSLGIIDLEDGKNAFNNERDAVFNSGRKVDLGANNKFQNDGEISPGRDGEIQKTRIFGNFTQSATGIYTATFNPSATGADEKADLLEITGSAELGGALKLVRTGSALFTQDLELLVLQANGGIMKDFSNMYTTNPFFGVERFKEQNTNEYWVKVIQGSCVLGTNEVICQGDLPRGVRFDDSDGDYTKLIVRKLDTDIAPDEGENGVSLATTDGRKIEIDVNTIGHKIVTKGNEAHGIFGRSNAGTVKITHEGGDIGTDGMDSRGIYGVSNSRGTVTITHQSGNVKTAGRNAYGISGQSIGGGDIPIGGGNITINLNGRGSISSNHETTGIGVKFHGGGKNELNIGVGSVVSVSGGAYDVHVEGGGDETITNKGIFTSLGIIDLEDGDNAFNNVDGAVFNSGREVKLSVNNLGMNNLFQNDGEISPGGADKIQTTKIDGDFTQSTTGIYTVTFDPSATAADLLHITGTATLGGKLKVAMIGVLPVSQTLELLVLKSDGALGGEFSDIVRPDFISVDPDYAYADNQVLLRLAQITTCEDAKNVAEKERLCTDPMDPTNTGGTVGAGGGTPDDGTNGAGGGAPDAGGGTTGGVVPVPEVNSASIIPSIHGVLISQGQRAIDRINSRLQIAHADDAGEAATLRLTSGTLQSSKDKRFWIYVHGVKGKHDATPVSPGLRTRQTGLTAGFDHQVNESLRLGVMASYGRTDFKQKAIENSGKDRTFSLGFYGSAKVSPSSPLRFGFGGLYNWHKIKSSRLPESGSDVSPSANHKARSWQVFGEASWRIEMSNTLSLEPFAGLAYTNFKSDAFTETGGDEVLKASSSSHGNTFSTLGVRGSLKLDETVRLYGMAGWRRAFGDINPSLQFTDTDGNSLSGFASVIARDAGLVQIGAVFALSPSASLSVSYTGQYAKKAKTHGGNLKLNVTF